MDNRVESLRVAYVTELTRAMQDTPEHFARKAREMGPEGLALAMFAAIREGGRTDWLRDNPCLRRAARAVGVPRAADVRSLVKGERA